ncbi:MAG: cytochrome c oxidase assembly protein [Verrucomicrobiota bacterium]
MNTESAALASWAFEPLPAFGLLLTALIYFLGWRKLHRQVPARYPAWRLACFLGGLAVIYVSFASPLDAFASFLLISHMVQHLLLTMLAPFLLLLGAPQLPLLRGLPRTLVTRGLGPFLQWKPLQKIIHAVLHPVVSWLVFVLSNVLWHLPPLYELALGSSNWHQIEHFCFLATATMFWWHVIQPWPSRSYWPRWAMIPYLLLADLQNTALAAFLTFYERILYPTYEKAPRIGSFSPLEDQAGAGVIMWVPGSMAFLLPAAVIAVQMLSPNNLRRPTAKKPKTENRKPKFPGQFDLLRLPLLGPLMRWQYFRRSLQILLLVLAVLVILDGLLGPQISPVNLAGVLPWTHWRAFTVVGLLAVGNLFCMACPFTFVRDLGRKILPASFAWPRALRSKWLAVALIVIYLWAYEAFDLWNNPAATAWIILGYFLAALLIDGFFRGASFCKFVCPIGQFHFVQSLASPFEVKIRQPDVCASCRTFDCLKGNATHRGCELELFQPKKSGNMDCTFCLDCVQACPHDNVGLIAVVPGADLLSARPRSSVGRYARRTDLAALVLVLTFGAFANAAGMVLPVLNGLTRLSEKLALTGDFALVTILSVIALVVLPASAAGLAAKSSSALAGNSLRENFCRFSLALAPLGFGMWLAHFTFHFFTAAFTPLPVFQRVARDAKLTAIEPVWAVATWAFYDLPGLEVLLLDSGFLLTLYLCWRIAKEMTPRPFRAFAPWGFLAAALYAAGVWIIFQPMEMRGMLIH